MPVPHETDVFVVGGGPAGLAAAIAARGRGLQVVVADWSRPPIEKPCGEGLMPDSLEALRHLGLTIGSEHSFPFRGIRFLTRATSVCASFPAGCGLGMRRTVLHQLLVDRAAELGVRVPVGRAGERHQQRGRYCKWRVPAISMDRWCGRAEFACPSLVGSGCVPQLQTPLRFPPALSGDAVVGLRRDLLGQRIPVLRHSGQPSGSLHGFDLAPPALEDRTGTRSVPGIEGAPERGCSGQRRTRRGFGLVSLQRRGA